MSEKFTQEKFEYFAKVIFNIFPHINYITLNNSENGNNTNYYIKFHKSAVSQHISLDGKHWEFKSEDNLNHSAPIYLKNIQYTPRTNGFYVVERKQKTECYDATFCKLSLKLLPLMEFCDLKDVEIYYSRKMFVFAPSNNNNRFFIQFENLNFDEYTNGYHIRRNQMYPIVKMFLNGETNK